MSEFHKFTKQEVKRNNFHIVWVALAFLLVIQGIIGLLQTGLYIASIVTFLNWFRRAFGNLHRIGIKKFSSGGRIFQQRRRFLRAIMPRYEWIWYCSFEQLRNVFHWMFFMSKFLFLDLSSKISFFLLRGEF